jgi:hypothetical protein
MSKLFFWFFPTPTKEFMDKKEIVIWLNGGVSFPICLKSLVPALLASLTWYRISRAALRCSDSSRKTDPSHGLRACPKPRLILLAGIF